MLRKRPLTAAIGAVALLGSVLLTASLSLGDVLSPGDPGATESPPGAVTPRSSARTTASAWVPPDGVTWKPSAGAVFNHPRGPMSARWRIVRTVDRAIRNAWPGSTVWIALYMMDSEPSADALLAAHDRGVHVRMAVDRQFARSRQMSRIARALNADNDEVDPATGQRYRSEDGELLRWGRDESFVTYCRKGCRGDDAFAHSKFYVFSHTGAARNVVMVGSSNLNRDGASQGWNDMYVALERPRLVRDPVDGFAAVHDEMAADRPVADPYREVRSGRLTVRFFPTRDGRDPVLEDLASVRCLGARDGAGHDGRTVVVVATFQMWHTRGTRLAHMLARLGRAGCDVKVLHGAPGPRPSAILGAAVAQGQVTVWNTRYDRNCDRDPDFRVHHKFVLVSGHLRGDPSAWVVHTGSQNWSRQSTRGPDDVTITIERRDVYDDYLASWRYVRDHYSRRVPHEPICPDL